MVVMAMVSIQVVENKLSEPSWERSSSVLASSHSKKLDPLATTDSEERKATIQQMFDRKEELKERFRRERTEGVARALRIAQSDYASVMRSRQQKQVAADSIFSEATVRGYGGEEEKTSTVGDSAELAEGLGGGARARRATSSHGTAASHSRKAEPARESEEKKEREIPPNILLPAVKDGGYGGAIVRASPPDWEEEEIFIGEPQTAADSMFEDMAARFPRLKSVEEEEEEEEEGRGSRMEDKARWTSSSQGFIVLCSAPGSPWIPRPISIFDPSSLVLGVAPGRVQVVRATPIDPRFSAASLASFVTSSKLIPA